MLLLWTWSACSKLSRGVLRSIVLALGFWRGAPTFFFLFCSCHVRTGINHPWNDFKSNFWNTRWHCAILTHLEVLFSLVIETNLTPDFILSANVARCRCWQLAVWTPTSFPIWKIDEEMGNNARALPLNIKNVKKFSIFGFLILSADKCIENEYWNHLVLGKKL